jgi:type 1 glutamine amidotransferase
MLFLNGPSNQVLATTRFSGAHGGTPWIAGTLMPVVWKRS